MCTRIFYYCKTHLFFILWLVPHLVRKIRYFILLLMICQHSLCDLPVDRDQNIGQPWFTRNVEEANVAAVQAARCLFTDRKTCTLYTFVFLFSSQSVFVAFSQAGRFVAIHKYHMSIKVRGLLSCLRPWLFILCVLELMYVCLCLSVQRRSLLLCTVC